MAAKIACVGEGWLLAPYDPSLLLECFPHLRLCEGFRLASYHFREGGHNNSVVFVIPAERELPPPREVDWESVPGAGAPLKPEGVPLWADRQLGRYLEGDGCALSFFEASLLQREAVELGATWHGRDWQTHTILTSDPFAAGSVAIPGMGLPAEWHWLSPRPRDWRPVVRVGGSVSVVVSFFSYSPLYRERIFRHRDEFHEGCSFRTVQETIARGPGGFLY